MMNTGIETMMIPMIATTTQGPVPNIESSLSLIQWSNSGSAPSLGWARMKVIIEAIRAV